MRWNYYEWCVPDWLVDLWKGAVVVAVIVSSCLLLNWLLPKPARPADVCHCLLEKGGCECLGR